MHRKETRTAGYYAESPYASLMMRQYARVKQALAAERVGGDVE